MRVRFAVLALAALSLVSAPTRAEVGASPPKLSYRLGAKSEQGWVWYSAKPGKPGQWKYESLAGRALRVDHLGRPAQVVKCKNLIYRGDGRPAAPPVASRDGIVISQPRVVRDDPAPRRHVQRSRPQRSGPRPLPQVEYRPIVIMGPQYVSTGGPMPPPTVISPVVSGIPGIAFGSHSHFVISGGAFGQTGSLGLTASQGLSGSLGQSGSQANK